jgi:hypothetical protein
VRAEAAAGRILSPDIFLSGPMFTAPGGHPAGTIYVGQHYLIDNATVQITETDDVEAAVRRVAGSGADYIKLIYDGSNFGRSFPRLEDGAAKRIVDEAHRLGLRVAAHTGRLPEETAALVRWGVDDIQHTCLSGEENLFREMAERKEFLTPTLCVFHYYEPQSLDKAMESVGRAYAAGVRIVAGTDFPNSYAPASGPDLYLEMGLLEAAGLPRIEALRAATLNAALALGAADRGSIEAGALADLVFYAGDFFNGDIDSGRVRSVILHGNLIVADGAILKERENGFATRSWNYPTPFGGYGNLRLFHRDGQLPKSVESQPYAAPPEPPAIPVRLCGRRPLHYLCPGLLFFRRAGQDRPDFRGGLALGRRRARRKAPDSPRGLLRLSLVLDGRRFPPSGSFRDGGRLHRRLRRRPVL